MCAYRTRNLLACGGTFLSLWADTENTAMYWKAQGTHDALLTQYTMQQLHIVALREAPTAMASTPPSTVVMPGGADTLLIVSQMRSAWAPTKHRRVRLNRGAG